MPRALEQSVETLLEAAREDNRRRVDLAVSLRLCDVEQDECGNPRWKTEPHEELIARRRRAGSPSLPTPGPSSSAAPTA
jgi:hypothetical protein